MEGFLFYIQGRLEYKFFRDILPAKRATGASFTVTTSTCLTTRPCDLTQELASVKGGGVRSYAGNPQLLMAQFYGMFTH